MESIVQNKEICLAVFPLRCLSDDPVIEMLCKGLAMDVITDLSRFRSFQIVPYDVAEYWCANERDSPMSYDVDLDYVVKGLVRYQNEKLYFNIQLINPQQNRLVWAEKFSGSLDEIFHIQEEMVEKIVVSLQYSVDYDLLAEIRKKPITNLNAYECWLRGLQELKKGTLEADEQARMYFQQAMDIDPHYARAYTGMSLTYFNEWSCQIWDRWEVSQNGAFEWAQKALELDERDHVSAAILGKLYLYSGNYEKSEFYFRNALRLNPNDAENLLHIALGFVYLGYLSEAHQLYEKVQKLNPISSDTYYAYGTVIEFELGNFDAAIALVEKHQLGKNWVDFPACVAAAYYHKGDFVKMRQYWQLYLQEFSQKINYGEAADNQTALKWVMDVNPFKGTTNLKPFWEFISNGALPMASIESTSTRIFEQNIFAEEGGLWSISFAGKQAQLPELKGFHDIARLLAAPNQAIHCTELMGTQVIEKGETVFDEKAKKAYQQRILSIQQELQEAEAAHHQDRIKVLQEEYDQLLDHLSKSLGLGGKTRKVSDSIDKIRSAVTWRIRNAVKKIAEVHPQLSKHLEISIKTGIFCEYTPEYEINWRT
ncbi:MAG: tetratricopeptide repeat protein [Saprospiraceae bacterium]|nr:tetratricopeptide repeat protein [Saprospiraceae bacterium]